MKRLIYRLSSLGDVILSQAALTPACEAKTEWVTLTEYGTLFEGHPRLAALHLFSRRNNTIFGWIALNWKLAAQDFDVVLDLHRTHRTRLAWWVFFVSRLVRGKRFPVWRSVSKNRFRRLGYCVFKRLWPENWRPLELRAQFARLGGGDGTERADLRWRVPREIAWPTWKELYGKSFYCVMPGASMPSKRWPVGRFVEVVKAMSERHPLVLPVVLGAESDQESHDLVRTLGEVGIRHLNAVGKLGLIETSFVLRHARYLLANDTGLTHLAEAVGTPVVAVYGAATSDFGFGLAHPQSQVAESPLWCRPCGKDGKNCHRIFRRHACLTAFGSEPASRASAEVLTQRAGESLEGGRV